MFKPQFAPLVASGRKRQTIRPIPKRMPKVGERESWREWSGKPYRSKTIKLAEVEITAVSRIRITYQETYIDGLMLSRDQDNDLAKADGFKSGIEMCAWFDETHGLPFKGILIKAK